MLSTKVTEEIRNKATQEISVNNQIGQIIKNCFGNRETNTKYLIAIQGCSSSGKSTIADNIYNMLKKSNIEVFMLSLDNYYKTYTHNDLHEYDFDNPGALDWDKINDVLSAFSEEKCYIPTYNYSFITKKCVGPTFIENKRPEVIILEGIYAFNLVNDQKFNIEQFDPLNSCKHIQEEFIKNGASFGFKVLKIKLSMCKSKSLEVRIERDVFQRNKLREESILQFENQVWPATRKWVNNVKFAEDIRIVHGSFNEERVVALIEELVKYFTKKAIVIREIECEKNLKHCFEVRCSGECKKNEKK